MTRITDLPAAGALTDEDALILIDVSADRTGLITYEDLRHAVVPEMQGFNTALVSDGMYGQPGFFSYGSPLAPTFTANRTYYFPLHAWDDITITDIALSNLTASGADLRVGIFEASMDFDVGALHYSSAAFDLTLTGDKSITGLSVATPAGYYMVGFNGDVDYSIQAVRGIPIRTATWHDPADPRLLLTEMYVSETYPASAFADPGADWTTLVYGVTSGSPSTPIWFRWT